jgi:hypothetical protein
MNSIALGAGVVGVCGLAFVAGRASTLLCPGSCAPEGAGPGSAALVATSFLQPGGDASQPSGDQPGLPPEMDAQMQAMIDANMPGEEHENLARMVGTWNTVMVATPPGAEPMRSEGTMHVEPLFEGRFYGQHFQGDFMGMPFEGMGVYGYSTLTSEYQYAWFDSIGTFLYTGTGQMEGDTLVFTGQEPDHMGGEGMTDYKDVFEWNGDDEYTMTRYFVGEGMEMEMFKITFTRE